MANLIYEVFILSSAKRNLFHLGIFHQTVYLILYLTYGALTVIYLRCFRFVFPFYYKSLYNLFLSEQNGWLCSSSFGFRLIRRANRPAFAIWRGPAIKKMFEYFYNAIWERVLLHAEERFYRIADEKAILFWYGDTFCASTFVADHRCYRRPGRRITSLSWIYIIILWYLLYNNNYRRGRFLWNILAKREHRLSTKKKRKKKTSVRSRDNMGCCVW